MFQHYATAESFTHVAQLMIIGWRTRYSDTATVEMFIKYFMKQWLSPKRSGWYDHYCDFCPCTNNALESTNRYIKDNGTFRQRLGIKQFITVLEDGFVKRWSTDRDPIVKITVDNIITEQENVNQVFKSEPSISIKDFTVAYQWDKLGKTFTKCCYNGNKYYCASSSDKTTLLTQEFCENYFKTTSWSTFKSDFNIHCQILSKNVYYQILSQKGNRQ